MSNDFCFWLAVYKDVELAKGLISQIQHHYNDIQIICVADGVDASCLKSSTTYISSCNLHLQKYGGAWVKRMFETYLKYSKSQAMIRVEPDTFLNCKFKLLPQADVAGNIFQLPSNRQYIHGGCVYFSRTAVEKILASKKLDSTKYSSCSFFGYKKYQFPYLQFNETPNDEVHGAQDVIFSDVVWELNLKVQEWKEVYSRVWGACPNPHDYTAIHPVKV